MYFFDPCSVPDNATTVVFGQTYQYQVTTSGTYSGTITYSLSNQPDNMTISSSGLIEWTPHQSLRNYNALKYYNYTHNSKRVCLSTQTYDLTVTGTCALQGMYCQFGAGDQRSSTDSSKFLGNITAYTDNASGLTAVQSNNLDCTAVQ